MYRSSFLKANWWACKRIYGEFPHIYICVCITHTRTSQSFISFCIDFAMYVDPVRVLNIDSGQSCRRWIFRPAELWCFGWWGILKSPWVPGIKSWSNKFNDLNDFGGTSHDLGNLHWPKGHPLFAVLQKLHLCPKRQMMEVSQPRFSDWQVWTSFGIVVDYKNHLLQIISRHAALGLCPLAWALGRWASGQAGKRASAVEAVSWPQDLGGWRNIHIYYI